MTNHGRTDYANTAHRTQLKGASAYTSISSYVPIFFLITLTVEIILEFLHILYLQIITFHPLPLYDEWSTMELFSAMEENPPSWNLLLSPQLEHRPLLPRFVSLLDTKLVEATGILSISAIDCMQLAVERPLRS